MTWHPRRRRVVGPLLLLLLLPTTAGVAPAAAQQDANTLASAIWPGVGPSDGAELATVDLVDQRKDPMNGAVIVASLLPTLEARQAMQPGDVFSLVPIDRMTVSNGRAKIHSPDPDILQAHRSGDGTVLLQLDVYTDTGTTVLMVERVADAAGRWVTSETLAGPVERPDAAVRFEVSDRQVAKLRLENVGIEAPLTTRQHQGATCSDVTFLARSSYPETLATSAVYKGIVADFVYTSTANTTSSLGVDAGNGVFSIGGSSTKASTLTADFNSVAGSYSAWTNREWRASWIHDRWYRHCPDPTDTTYPYDDTWIEQRWTAPVKVSGFPSIITSRYPLPGCAQRADLSGVKSVATDTSTAMTYQAAFKITWGVAAFEGSARSGYTSAVKMKFTRPEATGYWYWCGDNVIPQDSYKVRAGR